MWRRTGVVAKKGRWRSGLDESVLNPRLDPSLVVVIVVVVVVDVLGHLDGDGLLRTAALQKAKEVRRVARAVSRQITSQTPVISTLRVLIHACGGEREEGGVKFRFCILS